MGLYNVSHRDDVRKTHLTGHFGYGLWILFLFLNDVMIARGE